MLTEYEKGRRAALKDIGDEFAKLADQCSAEIKAAIAEGRAARERDDPAGDDAASDKLIESLQLRSGWMRFLQIVMNAEKRDEKKVAA